ncbi:N-6 DNA methylase [Acinetobacter seifertii]|uniref:Eco57I restriction-modification methylase domain-containing protein n=1 Tax=Acinetobacter seifertii TaxID=1530123 RepID=UPI00321A1C8A
MAINKRIANRQHRWLSSVEITGVVLSEPVLADAGNFRSLDKTEIATFRKQREIWNLPKGMMENNGQPAWINFILEDFLGLKDKSYWQIGASIPADKVVNLHEQQEILRPSRVLLDEDCALMLVLEVPREQSLDKPWLQDKGRWKASPTTKFERLLRETGVELGLLTNGEAWRLVVASPSETTSWMTWTTQTWNDDLLTLAAFKNLLGESRFFAGSRDQVLLELIKQSRQRQLDVADQLGNQVRKALQILIHELDRVDAELSGSYLNGYREAEIFESGVAFIMRLLFTLYAEENGLLPHGNVSYDQAYGVLHLLTELEETRRLAPEKLKYSFAAFARLLASARLLYDGSIDPDIHIAAHGGQLFDSDRYPLLEGRTKNGEWPADFPEPPKIRDSVIRDILRSLKYANSNGVNQLVSYRMLAVEQIGYMYEGLLDRRVARAPFNQSLLLLKGSTKIEEPEPVDITEFSGLTESALITAISKYSGKTESSIKKTLARNEERLTSINLGTEDTELLDQAKPVKHFLQPLGIIRPGGLYLTHGQDRRSSGTHYTPPTLTEPVVRRTLEHQVYVNIENIPGLLVEPKQIKTPQEILALKICDPAMGSGAFLVQATRYLAERLVDAWERMAVEQPEAILTMPFGLPSKGDANENLLPESHEERIVFARRYVAERCIYGVDMNRLAVEMAKLSLWLTTLSTDRPFTFVDHALKHGNSLVGLTPEQIHNFTWKPISNDFGPLFINDPDHEVEEAEKHREAIHNIADHDFVSKAKEIRIVEQTLANIRMKATLAIAAFFDGANTKQREAKLIEYSYWLERLDKDEKARVEVDNIIQRLTSGNKAIIPFCWEVEFPEVFYRKNSGFDAIIANPPWGDLGLPYLKDFWSIEYSHCLGRMVDLFHLFLINSTIKLINTSGSTGFILPDVALYQTYGTELRKVLLEKFSAIEVCDVQDGIFRGITRPCCISIFRHRSSNEKLVRVFSMLTRENKGMNDDSIQISFSSNELLNLPNILIPTKNVKDISFITTIISKITPLENLFDQDGIQRGASADKKEAFLPLEKDILAYSIEREYLRPVLDSGSLISPFHIKSSDQKLIYTERGFDPNEAPGVTNFIKSHANKITCKEVTQGKHSIYELHRSRNKRIFEKKYKIVGVITSDRPRVAVDKSGKYTLDGVYLFSTKQGISPYFVVGVLNSDYFLKIYRTLAQEEGRVMAQVKPTVLSKMPVPNPLVLDEKGEKIAHDIERVVYMLHQKPNNIQDLISKNEILVETLYSHLLNS